MGRLYLRFFVCVLLASGALRVNAQLSEGGIPASFKFLSSNPPGIILPPFNLDSVLRQDSVDALSPLKNFRFGYNYAVDYSPLNAGEWSALPNGNRIWRLDIQSPGALSINLAFSNFNLPLGARLFVYSKDRRQILGGFSSKDNHPDKLFGTELIAGEEVVIEYDEPAAVAGQGCFTLSRLTHGYRDFNYLLRSFNQAGACIHNINCPQYVQYFNQKRSVVCMINGGGGAASGAMVNNTNNDGTPYILTANHVGTPDGSWVFRFNWESPTCGNPDSSPPFQSISGATQIAHDSLSDFNLFLLSQRPPDSFNVFYCGWSRDTTPATSVTCIHHPKGDIKKCSQADNAVSPTIFDAGDGPAQCWQIGMWTDGATEPGSSGSPLLDPNKRIIGQLYGGYSDCGESPSFLVDYFGRFAASWDSGTSPQTRLKDWLDPANTNPLTNDGYDPHAASVSTDIGIAQIISPQGEVCDTISPVIAVYNFGFSTITSFTVTYLIDGRVTAGYNWSGNLLSLQTILVGLPAALLDSGSHSFTAILSNPNGSTDQNLSNDTATVTFIEEYRYTPPFAEGFEDSIFPPQFWSLITPKDGNGWQRSAPGGFGLSGFSAFVDEIDPIFSTIGDKPGVITPAIDLSRVDSDAYLGFDVANARYDSLYYDSLAVLASADCGLTWNRIYAKGGLSLATAPDDTSKFIPTAGQWRRDSINIDAYNGNPGMLFQFQLISGFGNCTYVDNVNITGHLVNGIKDIEGNMEVRVFPNPFANSFNLQMEVVESTNINISLLSMDGKMILQPLQGGLVGPGNFNYSINTGQLSNGVYLLKVNQSVFKLIKTD